MGSMRRVSVIRGLALLALGLRVVGAHAQLSTEEWKAVDRALFIKNCSLSDLEFSRIPDPAKVRLPLVTLAMQQPLQAAEQLMQLHEFPRTASLSAILERANRLRSPEKTQLSDPKSQPRAELASLPDDLRVPVQSLVNWMERTNAEIRWALKPLTPEEKRMLIEGLPTLGAGSAPLRFSFVRGTVAPESKVREILEKVDVKRICEAGADMAAAVERANGLLRASKSDLSTPLRIETGDIVVKLAGRGNDIHPDSDVALLIDLGGDDTYTGRSGSGVGACSVVIDVGGTDTVRVEELSMGAGLLGVGIAKFGSGDGRFDGKSLCFGAGVAGLGAFASEMGDDDYRAGGMAFGYGFEGVGCFVDHSGDDRYQLGSWGQGSGASSGIGWMIDRRGDDLYVSGGALTPLGQVSWAQGYGEGGIGLCTDFSGRNEFRLSSRGQGAGRALGLGTLMTGTQTDTLVATDHAQAMGEASGAGYLFDIAGDDQYLLSGTHGIACGQRDGVGVLVDRAGNDRYSGSAHSTQHGLAIQIDSAGNDRYAARAPSDTLAVVADLGGFDQSDAPAVTSGVFLSGELVSSFGEGKPVPVPRPNSALKPATAELERLLSQAMLGSSEAAFKVIEIGQQALLHLIQSQRMRAEEGAPQFAAMLCEVLGPEAQGAIATLGLQQETLPFAVSVAALTSIPDIGGLLPPLLEDPILQIQACRAAGLSNASACTFALLPLAANTNRYLAAAAADALARIGSPEAFSTMDVLITSSQWDIRRSALDYLAKFPARTSAVVERLLGDREEKPRRTALQLLGMTGDPASLKRLGSYLRDPAVGVRLQAAIGLIGRCPEEYVQDFQRLQTDPSPEIRAWYGNLKPRS